MYTLNATVKIPLEQVQSMSASLTALGVGAIDVRTVPFAEFQEESRLNWDCVFPEMWEKEKPVAYLDFSFEDSDAGRKAAYQVEFGLPQIPLNLHYVCVEGGERS